MQEQFRHIDWEDRMTASLCALFAGYGYTRYRMEKLEPYDLYLENKNYLKNASVITFPDASGRLMALKPDVTMSVVRNTRPEEKEKKVFYSENVFRMERDTREYREVRQIGLEYIGGDGSYPAAETLLLAARAMQRICASQEENKTGEFVLCLSHMDIVLALLEEETSDQETIHCVLQSVRRHRPHSLSQAGLSQTLTEKLLSVIQLPADPAAALTVLRTLNCKKAEPMTEELQLLVNTLSEAGFAKNVRIDFSIMNDTDYYNGISFVGYLNGVPKAVLSGGRYDNLMRRFGKSQNGLGFAVYIGELLRAFSKKEERDADVLVVYGNKSADAVLRQVDEYVRRGLTVRACRTVPEGFRAGKIVFLMEENEKRKESI